MVDVSVAASPPWAIPVLLHAASININNATLASPTVERAMSPMIRSNVYRRRVLVLLATIVLPACGARSTAPPIPDAASSDSDASGGYFLASFTGGFDDLLLLPPSFARSLPLHGEEATRESPGLHEPGNDQYFSYAVLWWAEPPVSISTDALRSDLTIYYAGLCGNPSPAVTLADPELGDAGAFADRRVGTVDAGSCFGAPVPLATVEVSSAACPDHTAILILLSPQPPSSAVWTDLRAIRDSFTCR